MIVTYVARNQLYLHRRILFLWIKNIKKYYYFPEIFEISFTYFTPMSVDPNLYDRNDPWDYQERADWLIDILSTF